MPNFRVNVQCLSFIGITYAAPKTALLIIDVQNCFLPGGGLAVPGGDKIIPIINAIRANYGDKMAATVLSQVCIYTLLVKKLFLCFQNHYIHMEKS